jgi:hypothetical protein
VGPGFAKLDAARSKAMGMLSKYASPVTLSRYKDIFLSALKEKPGESILTLIAKAKVMEAREEIDRLSQLPHWSKPGGSSYTTMRITRAALGDTKIEDEFMAEVERIEAEDYASGMREALYNLARIGTHRSLRFLCQRMRTPMVIVVEGTLRRSVRLSVRDALQYAFPGEPSLGAEIGKEEDYTRIEQFCTRELGVGYDGVPRPEFLTQEATHPWP